MQQVNGQGGTVRGRRSPIALVGLGTLLTAMHVALLTRRLAPLPGGLELAIAAWRWEPGPLVKAAPRAAQVRSNPISSFNVGHLPLASGMAVVVLAFWLHIMHISGVVGR